MDFETVVLIVGTTIDAVGVLIIIAGLLAGSALYLRGVIRQHDLRANYRRYRQNIGRAILLGLEFLVAGDIIRTVAISPTFESVGVLALIVVVRTFLSFSLEVEIDGRWPWGKRTTTSDGPAGPGSVGGGS
ncbi:DUF1622 domain-containing protein [Micromonospora sp. NBC_01813]|uniref:DUF1622 domain-containing protein n=1 Tax=Micromonospora sp. NBC_01813 TaxID=2975988 RepID=UPI002DDA6D22|nr:DUF1622 domain-containing protein [Micromonospora sp. NBC_01813]WSA08514.1 DUF1622 domain-containing protein [Micromonospora sp. NBC_01813]